MTAVLVVAALAYTAAAIGLGVLIGKAIAIADKATTQPSMPNLVLLRGEDPTTTLQLFRQLPPVPPARPARLDELA